MVDVMILLVWCAVA